MKRNLGRSSGAPIFLQLCPPFLDTSTVTFLSCTTLALYLACIIPRIFSTITVLYHACTVADLYFKTPVLFTVPHYTRLDVLYNAYSVPYLYYNKHVLCLYYTTNVLYLACTKLCLYKNCTLLHSNCIISILCHI